LGADLIVAGRSARFGLPEVDRGMNLSWSALPRLMARAGPVAGKRLAILGETLEAPAALSQGIVDEIIDEGASLSRAGALAELAAAKPPLALAMIKRGANAYLEHQIAAAAALDAEQFALATLSDDFAESMAAFTAKRPPHFKGK
jgi:enoyl-CoA hydratase